MIAGLASNKLSIARTSRIALSHSANDNIPLPLGSNSLNIFLRLALSSAVFPVGSLEAISSQSTSTVEGVVSSSSFISEALCDKAMRDVLAIDNLFDAKPAIM
jgi:hypothetical protein